MSILGAALLHTSTSGVIASPADGPPRRHEGVPVLAGGAVGSVPVGEAFVAGDMVVHWVDDVAAPTFDLGAAQDVDVDLTPASEGGDGHAPPPTGPGPHQAALADGEGEVAEDHHAAAEGGYALFSTTARLLPGGYTIRLTGADARVEQYRDEVTAAARAASATTGIPIRIAPGVGGPVDPARGEIAVTVGPSPCGARSIGCGGPALTTRELVGGRVWFDPSALDIPAAQRTNLAAHELGHALGLQHFEGSWTDGRQVMYPVVSGVPSYRAGDSAGLRRAAGTSDRPAGTVTSRTYAAGRVQVTGTVTSGTRIRLRAGSVSADVAVVDGRFSGSLPLPAGLHVVCADSLDPAPGFQSPLGCGHVEAPGAPVGHVDPLQASVATVRVTGWALDPQTAAPVRVRITRNGAVAATIDADEERDDLGAAAEQYGTLHGFVATVTLEPGQNRVCVQIVGVGGGGDAEAGCGDIDRPVAEVDAPGSVALLPGLPAAPPVGGTVAAATAVVGDVVQVLVGR